MRQKTIFTQFGLTPELVRGTRRMGFDEPTPIQQEVIPVAIAGGDVIATAETGSGKTAAFLLPLLQRLHGGRNGHTRALILSPTREIAAQTAEQCARLARGTDLRTIDVYGGVRMNRQQQALKAGYEIVVATPGRLLDHCQRGLARLDRVEVLILDEADRMMDMGFIPDLRRILARLPKQRQTMLFSATMPIALMEVAYAEILRDPTHVQVGSQSVPPEAISQSVYLVSPARKTELLLALLNREAMDSVLVFVRTRRDADRLASHLTRQKVVTASVHGDRSQREREQALQRFKDRAVRVLVATDVAARGLHIEGVTHVINYDVPAMPAQYLNRIGRTARAGASGDALTLVTRADAAALADIERTLGRSLPRAEVEGLTESEPVRTTSPPVRPRLRAPGVRRTAGRRRRR